MSTVEIAKGLVDLCKQGKNLEAVEKYYSNDIVSVESAATPEMPAETKGIESIRGKHAWWYENHEIHNSQVNGPFVGEDQFAVEFKYDVTHKPSGRRMRLEEIGLYTVIGGKIVHERFYYNAAG